MNIFRLVADLLHLASFAILIYRMMQQGNCRGISLKTHELYLVVFCCRYVDLLLYYVSLYNTVMKILFIVGTAYIVFLIRKRYRTTYDEEHDTFDHWKFLAAPSAVMALIFNHGYYPFELLWAFSIWLEAVAVLPQLRMLQKMGRADRMSSHYIFALGGYRALYVVNWMWRYFVEGYVEWIAWVAGVIQTVLYADFFWIYYKTVLSGKDLELPMSMKDSGKSSSSSARRQPRVK